MSYEILRGGPNFIMGISNNKQLISWLKTQENLTGVAFTGRSNVGKSSLINSLFGKKTARTSKTPGRTREINVFTINFSHNGKPCENLPPLYLFDLPGYGHAEISKQMARNWDLLMSTFFSYISKSISIVNIQDARHPNQDADKEFHKYLKNYDLDTILVFNKLDKLKKQKDRAVLNKLKPELLKEYRSVKYIHYASAEKKTGLTELSNSICNNIISYVENN